MRIFLTEKRVNWKGVTLFYQPRAPNVLDPAPRANIVRSRSCSVKPITYKHNILISRRDSTCWIAWALLKRLTNFPMIKPRKQRVSNRSGSRRRTRKSSFQVKNRRNGMKKVSSIRRAAHQRNYKHETCNIKHETIITWNRLIVLIRKTAHRVSRNYFYF